MKNQRRVSRRSLLRTALVGGSGLVAAAVVGCGDSNKSATTSLATETGATSPTTPTGRTTPEPTLTLPRWGRLPRAGALPPPRRDHSLVTDGERLYLFGGRDSVTLGDFWVYDLASGQWTEVTAAAPPARFGHNAGFDVIAGRVVIFGGQGDGFFNDIWAYTPTAGTWQQVPSAGGPSPRYGAAAVASGEPLIISHGFTDTGRFDDTWAYGAGTWVELSPKTGPRPIKRCLTRGVLDPAAGAFIIFGGQTDSAPFLGDTWRLTFAGPDSSWTQVTSDPKPSPRNLFSTVWDDERSRALLFGGRTESGRANDVWTFDSASSAWSQLSTQGEKPKPRNGHDAIWLPGRRSMIVFGGEDDGGAQNDLWELAFRG